MKRVNRKNREIIPIFFAVDDNYAPYLAVALRSLIDHSRSKYNYCIHILIDTLNDENCKLLSAMETENVTIEYINVSDKLRNICSRLHIRDYYSKATYYRFFIPELFPQFKKGLYLDCDIILTDDAANLYHCHMGKNLVAAVPDEIMTDIEVFGRYTEQVLNIPRNEYFNAGILVMNLQELRLFNIEEQFADLLSKRTYRVTQDQDYLNKLCYGRVFYLNKKWNKTPMPDSDRNDIPKIAHYKINYKPWKYDNIPYGELFWEYAEKTPLYASLLEKKNNYTDADKLRDRNQYASLVDLAMEEIESESHELVIGALAFAEI